MTGNWNDYKTSIRFTNYPVELFYFCVTFLQGLTMIKMNIVEMTLVPHTAFKEAQDRIEQCFDYALTASEPMCLAVIGESRTGKSRLLEEINTAHPIVRTMTGLRIPILALRIPAKPTVKGLAENMLAAMYDPMPQKGTRGTMTRRLKVLMKGCGTKMVLLDEFQHFQDKTSLKIMHEVADWLKILVDDTKAALVVAGLPECRAVIVQNEQLDGRFSAPILMRRFSWLPARNRGEFLGILEAFDRSLRRYYDFPRFDSDEMAMRFYCATGGLMGYLTKLLRQIVLDAESDNRSTITLACIAAAHDKSVSDSASAILGFNPFVLNPTSEWHVLAEKMGRKPATVEKPKSPSRARSEKSADEALA
jgi:hypothetical protein